MSLLANNPVPEVLYLDVGTCRDGLELHLMTDRIRILDPDGLSRTADVDDSMVA